MINEVTLNLIQESHYIRWLKLRRKKKHGSSTQSIFVCTRFPAELLERKEQIYLRMNMLDIMQISFLLCK